MCSLGGSEEQQPAEDEQKEGDASGSKDVKTQSSSEDGKPHFEVLIAFFENFGCHCVLQVNFPHLISTFSNFVRSYFRKHTNLQLCT